mgnify:CR=1 FL=1
MTWMRSVFSAVTSSFLNSSEYLKPGPIGFEAGAALLRVTPDEATAIAAYTLEKPYPMYKLLNAWLMSNRRDDLVAKHVGPYFALLYRAMEDDIVAQVLRRLAAVSRV